MKSQEELILPIIEDQYKISVIVEDDDSHRIMKRFKVVDLIEDSSKSEVSLHSFLDGKKIHIQNKLNSDIDSLWMEFQYEQYNNKSDVLNIEVKVLSDSSFIDTSQYELILNDEQIYNISYRINQEWEGKYTFFIGANGNYLTKDILIPNRSETKLWSEKKNELLGVMTYVLSHEESKYIYDLNLTDLKTYIQNIIGNSVILHRIQNIMNYLKNLTIECIMQTKIIQLMGGSQIWVKSI